jgi:hypothetical protein
MCSLYEPKIGKLLVSNLYRNMTFHIKKEGMLNICGAEICTSISQNQYNNDNVIRKHNNSYLIINY